MSGKLDNVVVFPGVINKQLEEQKAKITAAEKQMLQVQHKINSFLSMQDFELQTFNYEILKDLANYGDVMTFTPIAARRLICVLAGEVLSLQEILNEIEENC